MNLDDTPSQSATRGRPIGSYPAMKQQLYWRRAQLSRLLLGGVAGAGDRVAEEIIERATEATKETV
jgi:hypothetical protein